MNTPALLDAATEEEILNDMKNLFDGKTIIIISHRKKVLDYCMTNYVLNDGKLKKLILNNIID